MQVKLPSKQMKERALSSVKSKPIKFLKSKPTWVRGPKRYCLLYGIFLYFRLVC